MNGWMFPGQPLKFALSQPDDQHFSEIAALCHARTGFDLKFPESTTPGLSLHTRLQIHGTALSLWMARKSYESGGFPGLVTQHSMGIYPALAVCGVISEGDAMEMAARAGECMADVFYGSEYGLGCVIGIEYATLEKIVSIHGVYFANLNTSRHFLITGLKSGVLATLEAASEAGAFSTSFHSCDAPLHSPLMIQAAPALHAIFSSYSYKTPVIPLMSHLGEFLDDPVMIRSFLHDELMGPVFWEKTYNALKRSGVEKMIEIGAGDTLRKFNRWIESEYAAV